MEIVAVITLINIFFGIASRGISSGKNIIDIHERIKLKSKKLSLNDLEEKIIQRTYIVKRINRAYTKKLIIISLFFISIFISFIISNDSINDSSSFSNLLSKKNIYELIYFIIALLISIYFLYSAKFLRKLLLSKRDYILYEGYSNHIDIYLNEISKEYNHIPPDHKQLLNFINNKTDKKDRFFTIKEINKTVYNNKFKKKELVKIINYLNSQQTLNYRFNVKKLKKCVSQRNK